MREITNEEKYVLLEESIAIWKRKVDELKEDIRCPLCSNFSKPLNGEDWCVECPFYILEDGFCYHLDIYKETGIKRDAYQYHLERSINYGDLLLEKWRNNFLKGEESENKCSKV